MSALHLINRMGNAIPHGARRFILDRLGFGKLFARMSAGKVETGILANGMKIYFNPIMHGHEASPEREEPEMVDAVRQNLRPGSVFYDVGANIGFYSLTAATIIGENGKILAFEPNVMNLDYLRRGLAQQFEPAVELHPVAVGATDGTMTFDYRGAMSGRLIAAGETAVNPVTVAVRSIDSLVAEGNPFPDLIKIDVEGAEGDVLEGAAETLKRHPVVICEMHMWQPDSVRRAESTLIAAGYKLHTIAPLRDEVYRVVATAL